MRFYPGSAVAARQRASELATNQEEKCLKCNESIVSFPVLERPTRRSAFPGNTDCISQGGLKATLLRHFKPDTTLDFFLYSEEQKRFPVRSFME